MKYLTLLGDSTLENSSYTPSGENTFSWIRRFSPPGWEILQNARDGGTLSSIPVQVSSLHPLTEHLLLSVGGNDVIREKWRISAFKGKTFWRSIRIAAADFGLRYQHLLDLLSHLPQKLTVCTIYGGDFDEDQNIVNASISLFNREIYRIAGRYGIRVLDLYHILQGKEFFTHSIEPSSLGSATLAHHFWKGIER
jgi:lysophospholipase L1-like esterase